MWIDKRSQYDVCLNTFLKYDKQLCAAVIGLELEKFTFLDLT